MKNYFDTVLGHDNAKTHLVNMISQENVPHALLFSGPSSVGKRRCALAFAQNLMCPNFPKMACGVCASCRKVIENIHPDLFCIEPDGKAKIIKIAQIKELKKELLLRPVEGHVRVVIIDQANRMNPESQNAFLKILEEPPQHVYFLLISSLLDQLLVTVKSRCQNIRFGGLCQEDLKQISKDALDLDEASIELALPASGGTLLGMTRMSDSAFTMALTSILHLMELCKTGEVCPLPDWGQNKDDEVNGLVALIAVVRDLMLLKTNVSPRHLSFPSHSEHLTNISHKFTLEEIGRMNNKLLELKLDLSHAIHSKLVMNEALKTIGISIV